MNYSQFRLYISEQYLLIISLNINITFRYKQIFLSIADRILPKIAMTFRSLDMKHYTLIIPRDHAYLTISQIAQLQTVHFIDAGDHMNRPFQLQLKRVEELTQNINMMKHAVKESAMLYTKYNQSQRGYSQKLYQSWHQQSRALGIEDSKLIDHYEAQIEQQYKQYQETLSILQKLKNRRKQLLGKIACFQTIQACFGAQQGRQPALDNRDHGEQGAKKIDNVQYYQNYMGDNMDNVSGICYVVGLIPRQAEISFNKMIYRVSRGYACVRSQNQFKFAGLTDFWDKAVIVMYPSSNSGILQKKILKVMQLFCNSVTQLDKYDLKSHPTNNFQYLKNQYNQTQSLIQMNQLQLKAFFTRICEINYLQKWSTFVWKQKCIYETLNKLQIRGQLMLGNVYIPLHQIKSLSIQLSKMSPAPTLQQTRLGNPPTAFSINQYTAIAQQITDTYGIPRYKQMNPTIFTTVTFPFFFGVMFGDIGHGLVLLSLGVYLLINNQNFMKNSNSFNKILSRLRYMITMMGFFAFYCGWVYNDFIGFSYNFFGSCYDPQAIDPDSTDNHLYPKENCVYPFGLDPVWGRAENQLVYVNSLKMKISVIIAIVHMTFGIVVKAMNSIYFKKRLDFFFQFIPQITFMVILFGYMDFLIIFKWLKPWNQQSTPQDVPARQWAPSIISTMMNIGLSMGKTGSKPDGNSNMWGQRGNSWQDNLQVMILAIAFICIPTMLIPKPYIEIKHIKKLKKRNNPLQSSDILENEGELQRSLLTSQKQGSSLLTDADLDHSPGFPPSKQQQSSNNAHGDTGQIVVHQLIQTIQFVLGAVSNTASYLRLWALSLAHSQLAKVFFQKTLKNGIEIPYIWSALPNIIMFWILCWVTFGVLMCMDSMECFLHSLRLHWVQFQNKFYKGDGYKYQPVSIRLSLQLRREQENK